MTEPRCDMSDLYVSQCAHCRGIHLDPKVTGDTFAARFEGRCFGCAKEFHPGDLITAYATGYICTDCGTEA